MTITIFGATGMVGKEIVKQALFKGYAVKAFGRNVFTAGFTDDPNLQLLQGALFDEKQVLDAVKGSDAVLSALGGGTDGTDKTRSLGIKNIISQMENAGIQRIIAVGGKGCLNNSAGKLIMDEKDFPKAFLPVSKEHFLALTYLQQSSLKWTFVCPPDLINAPVTGLYDTKANFHPGEGLNRINTGDLAMFMLKELVNNEYIQMRVGISN